MCKFRGNVLCKLSKSEILRLYSIVRVAMKTIKTSNFTCQSKSFISIFSPAKFQLLSCHISLAIIWQMTYTHKLPKLCSPTNNTLIFNMKLFQSSINSIDKLNFPVMLHQKAMHYRRKNYGQKHCLWIMLSTGWITVH